jgi:hypothetical protein
MDRRPNAEVARAIVAWLVSGLLVSAGCENLERPKGQGGNAAGPPRPSVVGGCKQLCTRQSDCLTRFRSLGAEPLFVTAPQVNCVGACDQTARDPLVGKLLDRVIRDCASRSDCDGFYGCALRIWLTHLTKHPWKRVVLRAQRRTRAVSEAVRRSRLKRAMRLCGTSDPFGALAKRKEPAAARASRALASACAGAVKMRLESVIARLEVLVSKLEPDAHSMDCRELRAWKPPDWLPARHPARRRISRARALCHTLDGQRKLAFAVRYAQRDAALVRKSLKSGESGDAVYYKCVHKGKTLSTLEGASQTRAKAAAKTLREVCFEQFPAAFLTRHRQAGATEKRHCYKIRLVAGLISGHASRAVISARAELIRWAKERCGPP